MDRLTCNIVRDLMPLVLDEVASDDSKQGVEAHIETCETCRAYYEGMSIQISRTTDPSADKSFASFVRDVKRRNVIKKVLVTAVIVILTGIIGVTGISIINTQRFTYEAVSKDYVSAQLYLDSGDVVMLDTRAHDGHGIYWYQEDIMDCGDDEIIVYLTPVEPKLKWGNRGTEHRRHEPYGYVWKNGQLYRRQEIYNNYSDVPSHTDFKVLSLRWGVPEDNVVLYDEGDVLPDSPEGEIIKTDKD